MKDMTMIDCELTFRSAQILSSWKCNESAKNAKKIAAQIDVRSLEILLLKLFWVGFKTFGNETRNVFH